MSTPSLPASVLSVGSTIGRYFSVVSMIPALFLVLWIYALFASGSWSGEPNFKVLVQRLAEWSIGKVAWLVIGVLLVALLLNPLQFATTQLLEGYWGSSRIGVALATVRIRGHRKRNLRLNNLAGDAETRLEEQSQAYFYKRFAASRQKKHNPELWSSEESEKRREDFLASEVSDHVIGDVVARAAAEKALERYPEANRILPTRLGNVMRYYEDSAGAQYGLDAVLVAPHFALVAPERHVQYLDDAREQLDLAVQLCSVFLLATAAAFGLLVSDRLWLLMALVPYALAYIAYRAAVSAAEEYGTALNTIVDLNRRLLYDRLGVNRPTHAGEERAQNQRLMELLRHSEAAWVRYAREKTPPGQVAQ